MHKKVDKILVNSEAIKKQLINQENVSEKKIKTIYNGFRKPNFLTLKNKLKKKTFLWNFFFSNFCVKNGFCKKLESKNFFFF